MKYFTKYLTKYAMPILLAWSMSFSFAGCSAQKEQEKEIPVPQQSEEKQEEEISSENPEKTEQTEEKTNINLAALKGPTALGMLDLLEKNEQDKAANHYEVTLAGAPDELVGKIVSGELDIAAVPTNLAATLYQKTKGGVQIAALNTMGVLYLLETGDTIHSVADLKGKTIYATGQGSTPEYALNLVLEKNGLTVGEDVTVVYKEEHAEIAPLLASGEAQIALLPQPFVTAVLNQNEKVRVALDLTEEWDKATNGESGLTMGCIVVRKEFAEQNKEAMNRFLDEYKQSVQAVNSEEGLEHATQLAEQYDIMKAAVAKQAIPECNLVYKEGEEMKQTAQGFLQVLFEANPKSVGGALPDEDFYYQR